jgi:enterochelin esterase-like enzyme
MNQNTLLLGCALAAALPLEAQGSAPRDSAVTIGITRHIQSKVLGEDRPYLVYEPSGVRDEPLPVIVLLDGDAHFHHTTGVVRFLVDQGRMPPALVVAVPNTTDRTRDLTPAILSDTAMRTATPTAGGADHMLRFLGDELLPEVARSYGKTPFRVLVGHSLRDWTGATPSCVSGSASPIRRRRRPSIRSATSCSRTLRRPAALRPSARSG